MACNVELTDAALTAIGSPGGTARLGGKAALVVRTSQLRGMTLKAGVIDPSASVTDATAPQPDVTVSLIATTCQNCTIDLFVVNTATVIVNSVFEPALNPALLLSSLVSCTELQRRGLCDRSAVCTDKRSGGRQCDCPFGFKAGTDKDGSQCTDLCELAREGTVASNSSMLSPSSANVISESARLSFSNFSSLEQPDVIKLVSVWLWPKNGTRSASLSKASDLVQTGITSTGAYELQLRSVAESGGSSTICKLLDTLHVQCTPGHSAADADGLPCMPIVNLSAASVRIISSSNEVLFDGEPRAPIVAGDQLRVEVTVHDMTGVLVTRSTLGLEISLEGKVTKHTAPFTPPADDHANAFVVTIPEMWTQEPEKVQLHLRVQSTIMYTLTIEMVESSSKKVAMGSAAAILACILLIISIYLAIKHGSKAKAVVLSLVTKEGKMAWGIIGEGFDMTSDYALFFAINAAFNDTQANRSKFAPVYVAALTALVLSTLISLGALAVRGMLTVQQIRRRRRELTAFGKRKEYMELLHDKIEDAEQQCKQTYIGVALAVFEQVPMGSIGVYFLSQRYEVPPFQIVSLFSSGLMLGIKLAAVTRLPYWWAKLKKWQASALPVRERAALGTELAPSVGNKPNGDDGLTALGDGLHELQAHILRVARSAELQSTPAKAKTEALAKFVAGLMKMEHKISHYMDMLSAQEEPEPAPTTPDVIPHTRRWIHSRADNGCCARR